MMDYPIEDELKKALDYLEPSAVKEAMNYSLQSGGKRIRPLLVLKMCEACGINPVKGMPAAIALEMVHTYSLIHDDLPAMDNDDLRRGRLTCHKQFDEATAILAGDGLLTSAFEVLSSSDLSDKIKIQCISVLVACAGSNGMILGQILDMAAEQTAIENLEDLKRVHANKTGKLFSAALQMGCIVGDKTELLEAMKQLGIVMGIAFQIQDDILDVTQSQEILGKSNSDKENHKTTYVTLLGLNKAKELMEEAYRQTEEILHSLPIHAFGIEAIIQDLKIRQK